MMEYTHKIYTVFICKTCQNNFIYKNELMLVRNVSNIVSKYFLKNTCRRSTLVQRVLCWFWYYQLPLSAPNVANAAPGVATSVSPLWNANFPLLPPWARALGQDYSNKFWPWCSRNLEIEDVPIHGIISCTVIKDYYIATKINKWRVFIIWHA